VNVGLCLDYVTALLAALLVGTGFVLQQAVAMQTASGFLNVRLMTDLLRKPWRCCPHPGPRSRSACRSGRALPALPPARERSPNFADRGCCDILERYKLRSGHLCLLPGLSTGREWA
jgi:hypothetical protein